MNYFEYKVVPAPSQRRWRQQSVDGMDKYASTVADLMTEMGLEGWDFIGAEALKERRRRFFVLICDVERTLMIFRRPAQLHDFAKRGEAEKEQEEPPVIQPVTPRRVTRPDLVEKVAAGARRIQVNVVARVDEADAGDGKAETAEAVAAEDEKPVKDAAVTADAAPVERTEPETQEVTGKAHMLERAVQNRKAAAEVAAE